MHVLFQVTDILLYLFSAGKDVSFSFSSSQYMVSFQDKSVEINIILNRRVK